MATSVSVSRETMIQLVQDYIAKLQSEREARAKSYDVELATWQAQFAVECDKLAKAARAGTLKPDGYSSPRIATKAEIPTPPKNHRDNLDQAKRHLKMLKVSDQTKLTVSDSNEWGRYL